VFFKKGYTLSRYRAWDPTNQLLLVRRMFRRHPKKSKPKEAKNYYRQKMSGLQRSHHAWWWYLQTLWGLSR